MKINIIMLCLISLFTSCIPVYKDSSDSVIADKEFSESCSSCGTKHHYSYSWKAEDYAFLNSAFSGKTFNPRSPHGPTPACDSTYISDTPYKYLKEEMPALNRSTYESFLKKNKIIAVHDKSTALVKLDKKARTSFSLPGFSSNKKQVLICDGQSFSLYNYSKGQWENVDSSIIWIP